jgi:hypothetical protein
MSTRASNEFTVLLGVTSNVNSLAPALEWHCQQAPFCTYSDPVATAFSSSSQFTDFTQYRGNVASLGSNNEILLQDGSGLYGSTCTLDDCEAILYRIPDGRNSNALCPMGTEMVVSALGAVGEQNYILTPAPRVKLNGEIPGTCLFVNGGYRCESGQATLRFTNVVDPCDVSRGVECPFPLTGRLYGTCAADEPCVDLA